MSFEVCILGNSSATPSANRHPSAQYVQVSDHHLLIDCGEGTQMQMEKYHIKKSKNQLYQAIAKVTFKNITNHHLTKLFKTVHPSKASVECEIKKLTQEYINFEWKVYSEMKSTNKTR